MLSQKLKFALVVVTLLIAWAIILWLQWQTAITPQIGMLAVPTAMVLLGLLAGIALHENEK